MIVRQSSNYVMQEGMGVLSSHTQPSPLLHNSPHTQPPPSSCITRPTQQAAIRPWSTDCSARTARASASASASAATPAQPSDSSSCIRRIRHRRVRRSQQPPITTPTPEPSHLPSCRCGPCCAPEMGSGSGLESGLWGLEYSEVEYSGVEYWELWSAEGWDAGLGQWSGPRWGSASASNTSTTTRTLNSCHPPVTTLTVATRLDRRLRIRRPAHGTGWWDGHSESDRTSCWCPQETCCCRSGPPL